MKRPGISPVGIAYLRRAVKDGMRDQIAIVRPGTPSYDPTTGWATGVSEEIPGYLGPAHVHPQSPLGEIDLGEGSQARASVTVTIPYDADPVPMLDDHVLVSAVGLGNDPALTGLTLRILKVGGGGYGFPFRELTCVFDLPDPTDTA